MTFLIVNQSY